MKRILLSFLFIFGTYTISKAQLTINQNHMPKAGDTARYSIAILDSSILLNYQNNGANQTWRFDSLKAQRQNVRSFYNSANTPYSINNKIAEKIADTVNQQGVTLTDVYEFYTLDSNTYSKDQRAVTLQTGFFPLKVTPVYSDKDEVYQFPLNYNDSDSSTFSFSFNNPFPAAYYGSKGYRINKVDGWGTIHTPYGSFNCIRVVTDIVSYDSISFNNNKSGINSHLREYKWLTPQLSIPALTLSGSVISGIFIPSTVEYRDSIRNVPTIFAPLALFSVNSRNLSVGDTVKFNNNSISINTHSYSWSISPNTFNYINGSNAQSESPEIVFTDSGYYDVQLIASNNHGNDSMRRENYIRVNSITTALSKQLQTKNDIKVFPNPIKTGHPINLKGVKSYDNIKVLTIEGKVIFQKKFTEIQNETQLMLANLKAGHYFIQLVGKNNIQTIQLIVIN